MVLGGTARILLATVALGSLGVAQDTRLPVPDAAAQAQVEKTVKDLFKTEYARRTPQSQAALAKTLIQQAKQTNDDPTARYVLLREARDLAAAAPDLATAFQAVDELARSYQVEALDLDIAVLSAAGKIAKSPESLIAIAHAATSLSEKAVVADRYEEASSLLGKAESSARNAQDIPLFTRIQGRRRDLSELQKEYARVKASEKILADQPDDPAAALAVGRFLCLMKNDWERGLPLLAKGSDGTLKAAAEKELAHPTETAAALEVADAWWDIASAQKDPNLRRTLITHARPWYTQAVPGLSGLSKARIEKRLDEIEQSHASAPIVDLLALVDPKKDALSGSWSMDGPALLSPTVCAQASLQIPYEPPLEYDLKMVVEKKDIHDLHLGLPTGDVRVEVDVDNQSTWGNMNFAVGGTNVVKYNACYTTVGKPANLVVSVRRTGVTVTVDGRAVLRYEGDVAQAQPDRAWTPRDSKAILVGTWAGWIFRKMVVVPITGQGKKLR